MKNLLTRFRVTFFVFLNLTAAIIIAEAVLSVFRPAPRFYNIEIAPLDNTGNNSGYVLSDNPVLFYVPKPGAAVYNKMGFRGAPVELEKTPDRKRVVFMGDSVTYGVYMPYEKTFTKLLGDRLGAGYELLNLAVPGYDLKQEIEYLKEFGLKFRPDFVVFGITFNDLEFCTGGEVFEFRKRIREIRERSSKNPAGVYAKKYIEDSRLDRMLSGSSIYRYLKLFLMKSDFTAADKIDSEIQIKACSLHPELPALLSGLERLSKKHGFRCSFIMLPVNRGFWNDNSGEIEKQVRMRRSFGCVDLKKNVFRKYPGRSILKLFYSANDPCHFSADGHKLVAGLIWDSRDVLFGTGKGDGRSMQALNDPASKIQ